jgi:hypothetical protein
MRNSFNTTTDGFLHQARAHVNSFLTQHDGHQKNKIEKERDRNYCNTNNNLWFAYLLVFPHPDMLLAARRKHNSVN